MRLFHLLYALLLSLAPAAMGWFLHSPALALLLAAPFLLGVLLTTRADRVIRPALGTRRKIQEAPDWFHRAAVRATTRPLITRMSEGAEAVAICLPVRDGGIELIASRGLVESLDPDEVTAMVRRAVIDEDTGAARRARRAVVLSSGWALLLGAIGGGKLLRPAAVISTPWAGAWQRALIGADREADISAAQSLDVASLASCLRQVADSPSSNLPRAILASMVVCRGQALAGPGAVGAAARAVRLQALIPGEVHDHHATGYLGPVLHEEPLVEITAPHALPDTYTGNLPLDESINIDEIIARNDEAAHFIPQGGWIARVSGRGRRTDDAESDRIGPDAAESSSSAAHDDSDDGQGDAGDQLPEHPVTGAGAAPAHDEQAPLVLPDPLAPDARQIDDPGVMTLDQARMILAGMRPVGE